MPDQILRILLDQNVPHAVLMWYLPAGAIAL